MHFSGRVPDTKFSNHLLKLHVILKHWSGGTNIVNPPFWVSSTVANCYNICGLQVLWAQDAPMQFERCLSPVQFHLNTECSSAAATRIKNQRRSQESSYWSKNNRRKWRQYAVSNSSGSVYLWQLKNQFSSFCPKHCFLNQGGYDGKSWTRYSHHQDTKLITNSKSLRNGFRFFHVVFILDTLNKRLSWDLQNSNRLNHQLNSLQQWLNWLKNMFRMFLSSGPHGPEPGWSATHDLQSTSLGQRRGRIRTEVPSWLYRHGDGAIEIVLNTQITTSMFNLKVMWSLKLFSHGQLDVKIELLWSPQMLLVAHDYRFES